MSPLPPSRHDLVHLIDNAHAAAAGPPRPHLGASMLGHPCDRWLWLSFRWAVREHHEGRMMRLFRRGQREEETVIADLRLAGVQVSGEQSRVDFGAHVSGSIDGIAEGVPEAPKTPHLLEIKTHNARSFNELEKDGVQKAKPQHWVQMQVYMVGMGLTRALYVAVCKDDDRLYIERVHVDSAAAEAAVQRGWRITQADRMPEPVAGASPAWYQCKMCPAKLFCHDTKLTQEVNCRTCAHYTARENSTSHCAAWDSEIPLDAQREGCPRHVLHPDLVPWPMRDSPDGLSGVYVIEGIATTNGEGGVPSTALVLYGAPF